MKPHDGGRRPSPGEPRNYTVPGTLGGVGGSERMARVAVRRSFDDTRALFIEALSTGDTAHPRHAWLRRQVEAARSPEDLWLLRSAVFSALRDDAANGLRLRETLRRSLDGVMPGAAPPSGFGAL